jgi:hypothetical protein
MRWPTDGECGEGDVGRIEPRPRSVDPPLEVAEHGGQRRDPVLLVAQAGFCSGRDVVQSLLQGIVGLSQLAHLEIRLPTPVTVTGGQCAYPI